MKFLKKVRKINNEQIIAMSAMLVSLLTLILFVYQIRLQHKESRLLMTPRLYFNQSYTHKTTRVVNQYKDTLVKKFTVYSVYLENKGLGPAVINSMDIIHNDKIIDLDNFLNLKKEFKEYLNLNNVTQFSEEYILSQNEKFKLFEFSLDKQNEKKLYNAIKIKNLEDLLNIKVVYESLYEETFEEQLHK